ncbi:hypothetical protein CF66_2053 [Candidatus Photodesmus katoptron]|uniref:(Na+)-NQR maturation NqrM n=1 Tax=Candidatus Photodesmus anomalopis TaxID=28176 RepID=UPI0004D5F9CC|nr:(Na+)-NQR maturation NqrM [Candidatus Photodesmus katoptron]KEY90394.1 hypothetical protein CF66_2053 [Candidatus Photodesmus katoptron]
MSTFIFAFFSFLIVMFSMSIGYIFKKKAIKSSCSQLASISLNGICSCNKPCDDNKNSLGLDNV